MTEIIEYISLNYTWFLIGAIIIVLAIIGRYAEKTNFGQGKTKEPKKEESEEKNLNLEKVTLTDLINKKEENNEVSEIENINAQEIFNENSLADIPSNMDNGMTIEDNGIVNTIPTDINNYNQDMYSGVQNNVQNLSNQDLTSNNNLNQSSNVGNNLNQNSTVSNNGIDTVTEDLFAPMESLPLTEIVNNSDASNSSNLTDNVSQEPVVNTNLNSTPVEPFENFTAKFDAVVPKKEIIDDEILEDIDDLSLEKTQRFSLDDIPDLDDVDLPEIRDTNISENDIWKF